VTALSEPPGHLLTIAEYAALVRTTGTVDLDQLR
jgi:hypothetical protein